MRWLVFSCFIGLVCAKELDLFGGLLGGLAAGDKNECTFKCPNGGKARVKSGHVPTSNGCGSYGLTVKSEFEFTECCNVHDKCYDTCGQSRSHCDAEFNTCMKEVCDKITDKQKSQSCHGNAGLFYLGTAAFGCDAYLKAQHNACECAAPRPALGTSGSDL